MRIGVLLSDQPATVGGGFTFEQEIFDRLLANASESRHTFVVMHPAAKRPAPSNVEFPVSLPTSIARVVAKGRTLWLDQAAKSLEIDLLWSIAPFHPITDTPYITISWDLQHRLQPWFPEVSADGEWDAREKQHAARLRRAARIIVGTETGKAEIARFYTIPEDRICVLPHPTPRFALEAKPGDGRDVVTRLGLPKDYLLYPAQMWPHKNHANLLLALAELKARGVIVPLVLVGSDRGNGEHVQRMIRELGLASQVHMIGFVPIDDLVALYRNARALAYVSLFGPDNLPPLEAMALGCPVIAADVAAEQVGDAARLVRATDPAQIAAAIESLDRDALIAKGHVRARRFTGDDFVRGIFEQIEELVPFLRCWRPNR